MVYIKYGREVEEDIFVPNELSKKAILFQESDVGKLSICSNEQLRHFLAKAVLLYHLLRMKHKAVCEAEIVNIGKMDVFDITCGVDYEIESDAYLKRSARRKQKYKQAGVELVIIQIRNWTDDIGWLSDYIKQWIRPD